MNCRLSFAQEGLCVYVCPSRVCVSMCMIERDERYIRDDVPYQMVPCSEKERKEGTKMESMETEWFTFRHFLLNQPSSAWRNTAINIVMREW